LSFEDDYQLILEPNLEDDSGLAHWELFMPTEQILTVGPGYFWSFDILPVINDEDSSRVTP
jgi:hypothetical protein